MRRLTKILLTVLFPAVLAMPAVSTLLPLTPAQIDNRRLTAPQPSLERLIDPAFYKEAFHYVKVTSPVRALLVQAGAGLDYHVLGESPDPSSVLLGRDGWLFRRGLLDEFCEGGGADVVRNFVAFSDEIAKNGARVVFTVAPPKYALYPEYLNDDQRALADCDLEGIDVIRRALAARAGPGYIDAWDLFEGLRAEGVTTHFRTDTHFNYVGSIPWMREVISMIDAGIWDEGAIVDHGHVRFEGNLGALILPGLTESVQKLAIDRGMPRTPVVQLDERRSATTTATERYIASETAPAMIGDQAVAIGDSYLVLPEPSLAQYFADITFTDWRAAGSLERFLRMASTADVVVIEITAESLDQYFSDDSLLTRFRSHARIIEGPFPPVSSGPPESSVTAPEGFSPPTMRRAGQGDRT